MEKETSKKHRALRWILALILVLSIVTFAGIIFLYTKDYNVRFLSAGYGESIERLNNPYEGWVHTYDYTLADDFEFQEEEPDSNTRLCLLSIDLGEYADAEISDVALSSLRVIFDYWAATDQQMILRFYYVEEPQSLDTVYLHMEQVSSVINDYADFVYIVQGLFVGENGEMRGSNYLTSENITALARYLDSLLDDSIYLAVENSTQYLTATNQTILPSTDIAFSSVFASRVGLYSNRISTDLSQAEKEAVATLIQIAPSGGALVVNENLTQEDVLSMLTDRGITYLEDGEGVESLKNLSYEGNDAYFGITVYDYLSNHLGYYYVLTSVSTDLNIWESEEATIYLTISNKGFAKSYHRFECSLLLKNQETGEEISVPIDSDTRTWDALSDATISGSFNVKDAGKGEYTVYFMMTDQAGETIALGNDLTSSTNGYHIGELTIY